MLLFPLQMQVSVFLSPPAFDDWAALIAWFSGKKVLGKTSNPMMLPLPDQAPPEIPRFQAAFPHVGLCVEASMCMWTMKWLELPTTVKPEEYAAEHRQLAYDHLTQLVEALGVKPIRMASVAFWGLSEVGDPAKWVAGRFFREDLLKEPFNRPETLEIHSHKVFSFGSAGASFQVNSWARLKTEELVQPGPRLAKKVITLTSDINTLAESREIIALASLSAFFAQTWEQHGNVRRLYLGQ